eukprot:8466155-Pyramimonas_sp.AAC.1
MKGVFVSCASRPVPPAFLRQCGPRKGLVSSRESCPMKSDCSTAAAMRQPAPSSHRNRRRIGLASQTALGRVGGMIARGVDLANFKLCE